MEEHVPRYRYITQYIDSHSLDDVQFNADVIEVIDAISYHNNLSLEEVLAIRDKKKEIRGKFIQTMVGFGKKLLKEEK